MFLVFLTYICKIEIWFLSKTSYKIDLDTLVIHGIDPL